VLELLLKVEERGRIETARRLRERISGVFRFGIPLRICNSDPAALISDELSPRPVQVPQPAITDSTSCASCSPTSTRSRRRSCTSSHQIARADGRAPGDAPRRRWAEIEGVDGISLIPADRPMQLCILAHPAGADEADQGPQGGSAAEHIIPLSRQAVAVLRELHRLTGGGELLFPGRRRGRPIGEGAIGELYDAAGYAGRHVPHGWRASFSTILNDRFPADRSLIDQALAHVGAKGRVEAAYNRSQQLERMATCSSAGPICSPRCNIISLQLTERASA
jgi:hypothetical protein